MGKNGRGHISTCCVSTCYNTSITNPNLSFFGLPQHPPERRYKWLQLIGREDWLSEQCNLSRSRKICEEHFSLDAIVFSINRKLLKKTALPTRYLPQQEIIEDEPIPSNPDHKTVASKSSQTDAVDGTEDTSTKQTQTNETITDIICKTREEEVQFQELCDKFLTKELVLLIKAKDKLSTIKFKKNGNLGKHFGMNLYLTNPQAYISLQNILHLPCFPIAVKQCIQVGAVITDSIMMIIKSRVDRMTNKEKNCSLLIGSTKLKPNLCYNINKDKIVGFQDIDGCQSASPAARALVVMIRGLFSNWKQPVCYALVSADNENEEDIDSWIKKIINSLLTIGLNVRTVISPLVHDLTKIAKRTPDPVKNPYFIINGKKIYYIFDAPELIRSVRDSMLLNEFHFEGRVVKYEYIVKFYNEDQKKTVPLAEKLTNKHINPTNIEKKETEYATQLLSKTVASGLWNYINFNLIDETAKDTVEFITNIHNLFDSLSSHKRTHEHNEYKNAYCADEKQIALFEKMLVYFEKIKLININNGRDVTSTAKFVRGFLITIKSIMLLFEDLKNEGHRFLLTKNFHQEMMEKFLKRLAPKKLTSQQFTLVIKKSIFRHLTKFTQEGCSKEVIEQFLVQTDTLRREKKDDSLCNTQSKTPKPSIIPIRDGDELKITKIDYNIIDTPEKHSLSHICEYLLNKVKENHKKCHVFESYLFSYELPDDDESSLDYRYMRYINCEKNNPDDFVYFVKQMDEKFLEAFEKIHLDHRIAESVCNEIEKISYSPPCYCFPTSYLAKLFTRIKIFYMIRTNNREFRNNKRNAKYFSVPKLMSQRDDN